MSVSGTDRSGSRSLSNDSHDCHCRVEERRAKDHGVLQTGRDPGTHIVSRDRRTGQDNYHPSIPGRSYPCICGPSDTLIRECLSDHTYRISQPSEPAPRPNSIRFTHGNLYCNFSRINHVRAPRSVKLPVNRSGSSLPRTGVGIPGTTFHHDSILVLIRGMRKRKAGRCRSLFQVIPEPEKRCMVSTRHLTLSGREN